ncbi:hypothetical protein [Streptomyces sp. NPDC048663]|uniref:hypothetical protein n=1 Tax=Streptomyces sp. NPDC048663 TaxID=3155638 RepID=UPI00343697FA
MRADPYRPGGSTLTKGATETPRDAVGRGKIDVVEIETAWRSAMDLPDIVLGPVSGGRFASEVEEALEAARARCRSSRTALRIAGSAWVRAR